MARRRYTWWAVVWRPRHGKDRSVSQGSDDTLRVTYLVRAAAGDVAARAEALMLEQAVELPRAAVARDPWVAAHILGRVEAISEAGDGVHRVTIAQPLATTGNDPAQLLNVLFGNSSLQPDVVLADVDLPGAPPRSSRWGSARRSSRRSARRSRAPASIS